MNKIGYFPLGVGEIACFLSHRRIWKTIINEGVSWGFVAEDDIYFYNAKLFFESDKWIPSNNFFDIIKAETTRHKTELSTKMIAKPHGHKLRKLISMHAGAGGYFVSKRGASILLRETESKCGPVDQILFNNQYGVTQLLNILQLDPAICIQDCFHAESKGIVSTLDDDRRRSFQKQGMLLVNCKPKGLAKVYRELVRPFIKLYTYVKILFGFQIVKKIRYAGDAKWLRSW